MTDSSAASPARAAAPAAAKRPYYSTRVLLTVAAIGVALGVLNVPNAWLSAAIFATVPWLYGIGAGLYLLPGVLAFALLRRGGVALLTGVVAGLVALAVSGFGIGPLTLFVFVGVLLELPYLLTRYRNWSAGLAYAATALVSLVYCLYWWFTYDLAALVPAAQIALFAILVAVLFAFTWIGRLIAAALRRAGVARGI